ncbi:hypothetical protein V8C86DRAFT_86742 [Haematococcus lacustris]
MCRQSCMCNVCVGTRDELNMMGLRPCTLVLNLLSMHAGIVVSCFWACDDRGMIHGETPGTMAVMHLHGVVYGLYEHMLATLHIHADGRIRLGMRGGSSGGEAGQSVAEGETPSGWDAGPMKRVGV